MVIEVLEFFFSTLQDDIEPSGPSPTMKPTQPTVKLALFMIFIFHIFIVSSFYSF